MKNYLYLLFAQKELFWKIKNYLAKKLFDKKVQVFTIKKNIAEKKQDYSYFQSIIQMTQSSIFLALATAILLQLTNDSVHEALRIIKPYVLDYIPSIFGAVNEGDYTSFLLSIAAVGGVFIGLHYAGMSTLNGALYSSLPNNIRNLLIQERSGNVYIKFLSFLTYLSFVLASFKVTGLEHIYLVPFLIVISMGIAIFAFVNLGKNIFSLFDPTILSPIIFDGITRNIKDIQVGSVYIHDQSIQKYNNRIVKEQIDALLTLFSIAKKESTLSGVSLVALSKDTINFLIKYQYMKQAIPPKSLWYEEKYSHKDWYKMSDTVTSTSYSTATTPRADVIYDYFWIENKVMPLITQAIRINIENKNFDMVQNLLYYFSQYLHHIVYTSNVSYAYEQINILKLVLVDIIENEKDTEEKLYRMGLLDVVMNMPLELMLTFYESIEQYSYEVISQTIKDINWLDKSDIYSHKLNSYMFPELEWLSEKLLYESKLEDRIITPHWYQLEIIMRVISARFIENITLFTINSNSIYSDTVKELSNPYYKATILAKQLEFLNKLNYQFYKIEKLLNEYISERKIDGLSWSTFDLDTTKSTLQFSKRELLKEISKTGVLIGFKEREKDYPDFFGQFLHITGESLIDALLDNDLDLFKEIFPQYFYASLIIYDKLKPSGSAVDWRVENEIKIAASPIMDLIDLSGYAKLFAEYHQEDNYWLVVKSTWDEYFNNTELSAPPEFFAVMISVVESDFSLGHRTMNRTRWLQEIEHKLKKLDRREVYEKSRGRMGSLMSQTLISHVSALVRFFSKSDYGTGYDGTDIFIEYYLKYLSYPENITFGRRDRKDLSRSLQLELEFYKKQQIEDSDED